MKIFNNLAVAKKYKRASLAIGNFDGVHKGHQKIFINAKRFSKKNKQNTYKKIEKKNKIFKIFKIRKF